MKNLLCATDLTPKSEAAIERAALLADAHSAQMSLLHVVSPFAPQQALEETVRVAIERMRSRLRPPTWRARSRAGSGVLVGNPKRLIVNALEHENPDLLVIGPHRQRGGLDALQDTVAEKVVSARRCPVLIVQQQATAAYRRVLIALDTAAESMAALRAAERLGLTGANHTAVVHAYESSQLERVVSVGPTLAAIESPGVDPRKAANEAIHALLTLESAQPDGYELIVVEGSPGPAIMRVMRAYEPDLLVMGSRGQGRIGRALAGSVSNRVMKEAHCDILIVPLSAFGSSPKLHPRAA